jgi:hypothetical protein
MVIASAMIMCFRIIVDSVSRDSSTVTTALLILAGVTALAIQATVLSIRKLRQIL